MSWLFYLLDGDEGGGGIANSLPLTSPLVEPAERKRIQLLAMCTILNTPSCNTKNVSR